MSKKIIAIIMVGMIVLNFSTIITMASDNKWVKVNARDKNGKEYSDLWEIQYYYYANKETKSDSGILKKDLDKSKVVKANFPLGTKVKIVNSANKSEIFTVVDSIKKDDKSTNNHGNNVIFIYCKNKAEYDKKNKALSNKVDKMIDKNIIENKTEQTSKMRFRWIGTVYLSRV